MSRIILSVVLFFIISLAIGQSKNKVIDAQTGDPIPNAHVLIFDKTNETITQKILTSTDGTFEAKITKTSIIHISYIGFKTLIDTLKPDEKKIFKLKPDVFNLETFVITASCEPQMADKSIYEIQVISNKEIAAKGANNLTELLNSQLNMKISIDPALGSGISIQGLTGEHVKILIDGVPVVGRKNGNIDLSQINLNQVDHIEVIEGPMSVIYGSNALAGVINIITRRTNTKSLSINSSGYYETVGVYNFDAGVEYSKNKQGLKIHFARNFFDGFTQTPEFRSMSWKPKRQINGDLGYSFLAKKHKLRIDYSVFDELLLDRGNLMAPYFETAFDQYFYTTRSALRTDYLWKLKSDYQLNFLNALSTYDWKKNTFVKDLTTLEKLLTTNPDQHDTTVVYSYMGRGIFSNDNLEKKLNFQLGYDINIEEAGGKRIEDSKKSIGDYAGFLSLNYKGIKNLKIQPGLRYSYNTLYKAPIVYSLNAVYTLKKITIRGSAAKGFRAPSIKELFLDFQDINHNIIGNPDLKAEDSKNFNITANYNSSKKDHSWSFKGSAYYNQVNNIITLAIKSGGSYSYTNLYQYITKGFDIGVKYNFYPRISLDLSTGIMGILNDPGDELALLKFMYSPAATANLEYFFKKRGIRLNSYYKFTGKLPQIAIGPDDQLFETYISSYHNMEISANKSFYKNRFNIVIGAKNLFNNTILPSTSSSSGTAHSGGGNIPIGWGRSYFIKLSYNFIKY